MSKTNFRIDHARILAFALIMITIQMSVLVLGVAVSLLNPKSLFLVEKLE